MRAILTMLVLAATLAGCASGARLGEMQDLGTFKLGHNVVVATNATKGPFSKASLGRMVTEGTLTRETFVWTQGQDGWKKAEEVTELAQLFTVLPPPPPPGV